MKSRLALIFGTLITALIVVGCASGVIPNPAASPAPSETRAHAAAVQRWYNGVALPKATDLAAWTKATGEKPDIVVVYIAFGKPFPGGELKSIIATGAMPLIQWNPRTVSIRDIAAGKYDSYLHTFGDSMSKSLSQIGLSFGHEMNGNWYPWGCGKTKSADFVNAWRHIHSIIGTQNVTWVWTVDHATVRGCVLSHWYPGSAYVDWAGIDGYLRHAKGTFDSVLAGSVKHIRKLTGKPVLLTEVGVPIGPHVAARISSLYSGATRAEGVTGIVYFDSETSKGDYRPQDNPKALIAFQAALATTKGK